MRTEMGNYGRHPLLAHSTHNSSKLTRAGVHVAVDTGSGRVAVEAEWEGDAGLTSPICAGCGALWHVRMDAPSNSSIGVAEWREKAAGTGCGAWHRFPPTPLVRSFCDIVRRNPLPITSASPPPTTHGHGQGEPAGRLPCVLSLDLLCSALTIYFSVYTLLLVVVPVCIADEQQQTSADEELQRFVVVSNLPELSNLHPTWPRVAATATAIARARTAGTSRGFRRPRR
ncbi:hypothetical protein C8R44DRAFT_896145 [Mycena epipterygia]|nr:hypothetical protein C8R44DRAFT_896145 [Mycena epipterygia]